MDKHLVIFCPIVQWPVHFETDLEIAQQHLDLGWKVTLLHCRGALPVCAQNPEQRKSVCRKCVSRFEKGVRWLGRDRVVVEQFECLTQEQRRLIASLTASSFGTLDELKEFTVEGAAVGLAAVGSMVSFLREPKPDLRLNQAMFSAYLQAATMAFFSIRTRLLSLNPDLFVLFNGRFAEMRTALYAATSLAVPALVHERAGVLDRYSLMADTSTHDIAAMKRSIELTYGESALAEEEKKRLALAWYEEQRNNKAQSWYSFTAEQRAGFIPDFPPDRCNLVIFNSSEDEIESFPDWINPHYADQNEGIGRLAATLGGDQRFKLYLRVHPNLRNIDNSQTRGIKRIEALFPELTVIPADSPMSSYGILDACDMVLVFGSTIGIEAVHSGKPSFLMGRAYYEDLGCCVMPDSHEDLVQTLSRFADGDRSMLPSRDAALLAVVKYGFFQRFWGETYKYVQPRHVGKSVLVRNGRETVLRPSVSSWLVDKVRSWARI